MKRIAVVLLLLTATPAFAQVVEGPRGAGRAGRGGRGVPIQEANANETQQRLQELLDRQDHGTALTLAGQQEAEGLANLAELLSLLSLRGQRAAQQKS